MSALADAEARSRIQNDLAATFVVEAAAGTGKTTALVGRIVAVVKAGLTTLDRVVAVTFTEKAAGEMKLRLRTELERARQSAQKDAERVGLERALAALEVTHINTIHGFCADLLRERPIEAGIDPAFRVLDETEAQKLVAQAFQSWFERVLSDPPEAVRRVLRRRGWRAEGMSPREQLLRACASLVEHRDFVTPWALPEFDRGRAIDDLVQRFRGLGALRAQGSASDPLARALGIFHDWVERLDTVERVRPRDYDGLEAEFVGFEREHEKAFTQQGRGRLYGTALDRNAVTEQREQAKAALTSFLEAAEADLAARLREELAPVLSAYETLKRTQGVVDFVDLLLCARDLLKRDARVRERLQQRFTHVFVDEFQDTDPLQAEILLLLAAGDPEAADYRSVKTKPGKLFVVGDPKQSVYRFRRADVAFYEKIKRALLHEGAELLHLTTNFRSVRAIQSAVNAAFALWMTGAEDGSQAEYVPLTPFRSDIPNQPSVIALPVPEPYGRRGRLTKTAVNASYPEAVAAFVKWLLEESGWRVVEGDDSVAVSSRHVCLLFRRFQSYGSDLTHPYVRALENRRIPHVLVGGRSYHGREEVMALRTVLEAVEWPDDELSVYATLRGPLFGIADEDLLCFRNQLERLHPLRRFDAAERREHGEVIDALEVLGALHLARNRRPIADTVEQLLSETRAHASLAMWPTGEQALANALSIIDFAHSLESRGVTSFRAFLEALTEQAERGQGGEAPIIEEGTEGVRLMTVHKAKGLEFPVVILCDPTAPLESARGMRYVDLARGLWAEALCGCRPLELLQNQAIVRQHDQAEYVRLAYVAATRARDLLVVPTFGDAAAEKPGIGWMDTMAPALYPVADKRRQARPAPGCPRFGDDTVLTRPAEAEVRPDEAVLPGLHSVGGAEIPVVWWDPAGLALGVESLGGIRQQELLAEPAPGTDGGIRAYAEWQARRKQTVLTGSAASIVVARITELANQVASRGVTDAVAIERTAAERLGRPRGPRFGTLVHAVLSEVPLNADASTVEALAGAQARLLGGTAEEQRAAVATVVAALAHPLLERALSAPDVRREVPIVHQQPDGALAEGVIDLAFREPDGWTIIDFKTDAAVAPDSVYAAQLNLYVEAVRRATGEPARGVLLMV
jgi:ATP-dependent helicase/nuclease subunit A